MKLETERDNHFRTMCRCDYCGTKFPRRSSEVDRHYRHFCDNKCKYNFQRSDASVYRKVPESPTLKIIRRKRNKNGRKEKR